MGNSKYVFNEANVLLTQLGEEGIAYDIESNEYFTLNETLFSIADGIKNNLSIDAILVRLLSEYEITEELCRTEVSKGIELLLEKKIILIQSND